MIFNVKNGIDLNSNLLKYDFGCGRSKRRGFIGIDVTDYSCVDIISDYDGFWNLANTKALIIFSSHFIEHFQFDMIIRLFELWKTVLIDDGILQIIFPDLSKVNRKADKNKALDYAFGAWKDEYDHHKSFFSVESMKYLLAQTGFKDIYILNDDQLSTICHSNKIEWSTGIYARKGA